LVFDCDHFRKAVFGIEMEAAIATSIS